MNVDIEQFWKDDALAHENNCFSQHAPQVAMGVRMGMLCIFDELGEPFERPENLPYRKKIELTKRYNDKAEKIVGRRLLNEDFQVKDALLPPIRHIGEVFGGKYVDNGKSEWLLQSCSNMKELETMLDRVEKMDLREFILPSDWERKKKRIFEKYGRKPDIWRSLRGPVTLAASIYGIENLVFLIIDEPDLAKRFSKVIGDVICGIAGIMDEEAGYVQGNASHGFGFNDDNCYLLTPEMYEIFGYPILKRVFERFSPRPEDKRYQHSDSDMGHLLPVLGRLNLTGCNFGPKALVDHIRKYMPKTRIDGVISPYALMLNNEEQLLFEAKRDCAMAKESRGLNLATAGSVNEGSLLTSYRTLMFAIQNYGRYD